MADHPVFIAPLLYGAGAGAGPVGASVCVDITVGDNTTPVPGQGYVAAPGFDAVTGWGVPNGSALVELG
jgi:kumamolisin